MVFFWCQPADAQVVVDGSPRGSAEAVTRSGGLRLPVGLHRFEITRPGHAPYRIELNVGTSPERLRVQLRPLQPDNQSP